MTKTFQAGKALLVFMIAMLMLVPSSVSPAVAASYFNVPTAVQSNVQVPTQTPPVTLEASDPSNRVKFQVRVVSDGSSHGVQDQQCSVNTANGYIVGDNTAQDGVACIGDTITYGVSYTVQPSATPTTLTFDMRGSVQNLAGSVITGDSLHHTGMEPSDFLKFCLGGTGFAHTGTVVRDSHCSMTFPASNASTTTDAGLIRTATLQRSILDYYYQLQVQVGSAPKVLQANANRTRVIGATLADLMLRNGKISTIFENGVAYQQFPLEIIVQGAWATRGMSDYVSHEYNATGEISLGALPAGTKVSTSTPSLSVLGDKVQFSNWKIKSTSLPYDADKAATVPNGSIFIKIPVSSIPQTGAVVNSQLTSLTMTRLPRTGITNEIYPSTHTGAWRNNATYTPGLGKASNYDTSMAPDRGTKGIAGHLNNDWSTMTVNLPSTTPTAFNDLYRDNAGNPDLNKGLIEGTGNGNSRDFVGSKYWNAVGVGGFPGELVDTTYCNIWDSNHQRIDGTRKPYGVAWNDITKAYDSTPITIQYGVNSRNPLPLGSNAANQANNVADCGDNGSTVWSDTPGPNTNMYRVSFDNDMTGAVSPSVARGPAGVHVAWVPFTTAPASSFPNLPNATSVQTTSILSNKGTYLSARDTASTVFDGKRFDALPLNMGPATMNSGTQNALTFSQRQQYYVPAGESLVWQPEYNIKIASAFSSLDFTSNFTDNWDIMSVVDANFGPDGLPGTGDDVNGWSLNIKAKKALTYTNTLEVHNVTPVNGILATLPAYIPNNTKLNLENTVINVPAGLGDNSANNKATAQPTSYTRATVAQSKWLYSPRHQQAGKDVSWGISWSNTSTVAEGPAQFIDILPYNGDGRGTKMAKPLSNIRFNLRTPDTDIAVEVTDADPKTITPANISNGTVKFVLLKDRALLTKEITAFRVTEQSVNANAVRLLEVTASTQGLADNDVIGNRLEESSVLSMGMPITATVPVLTVLFSTKVSGQTFYDLDKDGKKGPLETAIIRGATVALYDKSGAEVGRSTTKEDGSYSFDNIELGEYTVSVIDKGANVPAEWMSTSVNPQKVNLTVVNNKALAVNFGYFGAAPKSAIEVSKSVDGVAKGATINHGQDLNFVFVVRNTGDAPLANVTLQDDVLGPIDCAIPVLYAGDSFTCRTTVPASATDPIITENPKVKSWFQTILHPVASKIGFDSTSRDYYTGEKLCDKDFCPNGDMITGLQFTESGNLIASYGDWTSNVDSFGNMRVSLEELNPVTGEQLTASIPLGTEATETIRTIDGHLYIPTIDPSDKPAYGQKNAGTPGVWTNRSGKWEFITSSYPMIHVFDVAKAGNDLYFAGSAFVNGLDTGVVVKVAADGTSKVVWHKRGDHPYMPRVTSIIGIGDGKIIFNHNESWEIYLMDTKTGEVEVYSETGSRMMRRFHMLNDRVVHQDSTWIYDTKFGYSEMLTQDGSHVSNLYSTDEGLYYLSGQSLYLITGFDEKNQFFKIQKIADIQTTPNKSWYNHFMTIAVRDGWLYMGDVGGHIYKEKIDKTT